MRLLQRLPRPLLVFFTVIGPGFITAMVDNDAGGMMNSDFISVLDTATVADALKAIAENAEQVDTLTNLFLVDADGRLSASLPVARLLLANVATPLRTLAGDDVVVSVPVTERRARVVELVDKYNLMALPVIDEAGLLIGSITADDIISVLRQD